MAPDTAAGGNAQSRVCVVRYEDDSGTHVIDVEVADAATAERWVKEAFPRSTVLSVRVA